MAQNQSETASPARKTRSKAGIWILLAGLLLLVGASAFLGLRFNSSLRSSFEALQADQSRREELVRSLSGEKARREAELQALRDGLADRDARIAELGSALAEEDEQIQAQIDENARQEDEIRKTEVALSAAVLPVPAAEASPEPLPEGQPAEASGPQPDAWGYVDEDGDGLILVPIRGKFTGYMLIVLDPSRVVLGCDPDTLGIRGHMVEYFVERCGAVAGINGGGFVDPDGMGDGSVPDTLIVSEGRVYFGGAGIGYGFVGLDDQYKLHVGVNSVEAVHNLHILEGCGYGPVLVKDGQISPDEKLVSGLNPRTAIGQRSDGAILMLAVEGRQPSRIGCSYRDEAELMLRFGAVNACNLDGGASTMLWYESEYINNRAHAINPRNIPTSFIVLKEGRDSNG